MRACSTGSGNVSEASGCPFLPFHRGASEACVLRSVLVRAPGELTSRSFQICWSLAWPCVVTDRRASLLCFLTIPRELWGRWPASIWGHCLVWRPLCQLCSLCAALMLQLSSLPGPRPPHAPGVVREPLTASFGDHEGSECPLSRVMPSSQLLVFVLYFSCKIGFNL